MCVYDAAVGRYVSVLGSSSLSYPDIAHVDSLLDLNSMTNHASMFIILLLHY